jgi:hypothetical protein
MTLGRSTSPVDRAAMSAVASAYIAGRDTGVGTGAEGAYKHGRVQVDGNPGLGLQRMTLPYAYHMSTQLPQMQYIYLDLQ